MQINRSPWGLCSVSYSLDVKILSFGRLATNCGVIHGLVTQFYSAALAIAASSSITNNLLIRNVPIYAPSVSPTEVLRIGPYDLEKYFSGATLLGIREAYVVSLRGAWAMCIALWGVAFFTSFLAKWPGRMLPENQEIERTERSTSGDGEKAATAVAL
jgi:hypothetical protein